MLSKKIAQHTQRKMKAIFKIALENGHDSIILSAFGCGAYLNPPCHIAKLFHNLIDSEFKNLFKLIIFAIIEDHNSKLEHNPEGNLLPFAKEFKLEPIQIQNLKTNLECEEKEKDQEPKEEDKTKEESEDKLKSELNDNETKEDVIIT